MILLDTHVLIWMAVEPKKLSRRARSVILEARSDSSVAISAITLWELAWIAQNGRIQFSGLVEAFVRECAAKVVVLPITPEIAVQAAQLPSMYPKDPQDRLIGSTAMVKGLSLVTADERIRRSKVVTTIW